MNDIKDREGWKVQHGDITKRKMQKFSAASYIQAFDIQSALLPIGNIEIWKWFNTITLYTELVLK